MLANEKSVTGQQLSRLLVNRSNASAASTTTYSSIGGNCRMQLKPELVRNSGDIWCTHGPNITWQMHWHRLPCWHDFSKRVLPLTLSKCLAMQSWCDLPQHKIRSADGHLALLKADWMPLGVSHYLSLSCVLVNSNIHDWVELPLCFTVRRSWYYAEVMHSNLTVTGIYTSSMKLMGLAQSDSWLPLVLLQGGMGLHQMSHLIPKQPPRRRKLIWVAAASGMCFPCNWETDLIYMEVFAAIRMDISVWTIPQAGLFCKVSGLVAFNGARRWSKLQPVNSPTKQAVFQLRCSKLHTELSDFQ